MTESLPSGMTPMELVYEGAIQYIASRNSSISPPDLNPPSLPDIGDPTPTPHIKESSYGVGRQPLDESGRRRGRGLGLEGGANDGLDSRYMKYRIHSFKQWE